MALDLQEPEIAQSTALEACESCGFAPTEAFQFERRTGFIIFRTVHSTRPLRLCKDCARSIGRSYQADTMALGWWGILSALTNPLSIWRNWQGLRRAMHMDSPKPTPAAPDHDAPLLPGRPVHQRIRFWILPLIVALIAGFAIYDELQPQTANEGRNPPVSDTVSTGDDETARSFSDGFYADFKVGNCVNGGATVTAVYCFESHNGMIVDRVLSASDCPNNAESYVERGPWVYCIDDR